MRSGSVAAARVYLHTMGCPKNDADSRGIGRQLTGAGVTMVDDPAGCTHIVVNTCAFIREAKEESIEAILDVCSEYPDKRVLVMGCLVARYGQELARGIPEVAGWFGVGGADVGAQLEEAILGLGGAAKRPGGLPSVRQKAYAYVKISDGCDEGCTFCAIPSFKGAYQSVPTAEILREADACLAEGARELVLVGQDTTRWSSAGLSLSGLIDLLGSDPRVRWIRVMYLQPVRIDQPFLEFMGAHGKLCRYLDVPFQHSDLELLRRMGRWGHGGLYLELLERARREMPDVSLRSTFIVGFPGETEQQFEHLMDFVEAARFDYAGGFVYSPEEGTKAAGLRPGVNGRVARRRLSALNDLIWQTSERERGRMIGTEFEVMIDALDEDELVEGAVAVGRTRGQAPEVDGVTYVEGSLPPGVVAGDVVKVRINAVAGCDLIGEICAA